MIIFASYRQPYLQRENLYFTPSRYVQILYKFYHNDVLTDHVFFQPVTKPIIVNSVIMPLDNKHKKRVYLSKK